MAGKRLLDVAKLINAGTSVAKQHYTLRRQQWEVYSQTSSLAKAVKSQTDRITVTAAAAFELAKRFNETGPSWQQGQQRAQETYEDVKQAATSEQHVQRTAEAGERVANAAVEEYLSNSSEKISSGVEVDDGTLSSLRRRELQRQAERQIPATSADDAQHSAQQTGGQDTFSERTGSSSAELSSLPRTKLPKHAGETQGRDEHVADKELNQDVYYATSKSHAGIEVDSSQGEARVEGVDTNMFASPRVSKILGQSSGEVKKNPYAGRQKLPPRPLPEMVAARERWEKAKQENTAPALPEQPAAATSETVASASDTETQNLAASIAQETSVSRFRPPALFHLRPGTDALTAG